MNYKQEVTEVVLLWLKTHQVYQSLILLCIFSSPGASRSAYSVACCLLSLVSFHIFNISRLVSGIELKLGVRHCGYMEIQNY